MRRTVSRRVAVLLALTSAGLGTTSAYAAPANDNFADRQPLGSLSIGGELVTVGSNADATVEDGESTDCAAGATVWFEIEVTEPGRLTLSTEGSDYDTTLGLFHGTAVDALDMLSCNDDAIGLTSRIRRSVQPGTYAVQLGGFFSEVGAFSLAASLAEVPAIGYAGDEALNAPVVTLPASIQIDLTPYTSSSDDDISWCWGSDQTAWLRIEPATDIALQLESPTDGTLASVIHDGASPEMIGCADGRIDADGNYGSGFLSGARLQGGESYLLQISNWWEADAVVTINLSEAAAPANDDLADAAELPVDTKTFGSTIGASAEENEPASCGVTDAGSVWYRYAPQRTLAATATLERIDQWATISVYKQDGDGLALIECGYGSASALVGRNQPLFIQVTPDWGTLQGSFVVRAAHGYQRCLPVACAGARIGKSPFVYAAGPLVFAGIEKDEGRRPYICAGVVFGTCVGI